MDKPQWNRPQALQFQREIIPSYTGYTIVYAIASIFYYNAILTDGLLATLKKFNWLWPNDAIWRQRSGSTLAQVMACCLTAPSHYLNQCWFTISKVYWHSFEYNFTKTLKPLITKISLKITFVKFLLNLPGANELREVLKGQLSFYEFANPMSLGRFVYIPLT